MNTQDLELPLHLYIETSDPDGEGTHLTCSAEKVVAWADYGKGDAIERLCRQGYDRDDEAIRAWEDHRYLLLEEQWAAVENGVDDDEEERRYALACEAVGREAAEKRAAARARMEERRSGLVELVQQSREYLAANHPAGHEKSYAGLLFILAAAAVLAFVLLT